MNKKALLYGGKLWQWENLANSLQKVIGRIKFDEFSMYIVLRGSIISIFLCSDGEKATQDLRVYSWSAPPNNTCL